MGNWLLSWLILALLTSSLCQTLSTADLRDPDISALIAKKLCEFHDLDMPGRRNVSLWQRLRRWLEEAVLEKTLSGVEQSVTVGRRNVPKGRVWNPMECLEDIMVAQTKMLHVRGR